MPVRSFRAFIALESSAGIILFCTALVALIIDNTPWHIYYDAFFRAPFTLQLGDVTLKKSLQFWINDGLMAIFFLLVGLEIKRELLEGELSTWPQALLPAIAALGGMVVPALFYIACTHSDPVALRGWAIPIATDIAFSLAILALLGRFIPMSAKVFLTALAIFDDLGAVLVIAIFYTSHISGWMLCAVAVLIFILYLLNRYAVMCVAPYILVGIVLWVFILQSGIHATLAGIVVAFAIPIRDSKGVTRISPLRHAEQRLHPWVAFGVLPLFALANAGVSFRGLGATAWFSTVPLAIAGGLFIGKQLGVWGATWLAVRFKIAALPKNLTSLGVYGLSLLAGIGFTMSLFIGALAFDPSQVDLVAGVRLGVFVGSAVSGIVGYLILRAVYVKRVRRFQ